MWLGYTEIDPRTARFAVTSVPRGIDFRDSAFGLLVAARTHKALLERLGICASRRSPMRCLRALTR